MNTMLRVVALTIALAALGACTTVSTHHPIGIANGEANDTSIMGSWKFISKDMNDTAFAFILSQPAGGIRGVLVVASENEWWEAEIVAGKAGDHGMLNVRPLRKNGDPVEGGDKIEGYYPLRYSVGADGNIALFLWSDDAMKDAVRQGRIAGTATASGIVLTAESKELDAFFAQMAPVIFPMPYATLERMK
jgi:hypothetical protein